MKKLGLLVMPLMAVSFLASCGGSKTTTYKVSVGTANHLLFTTVDGKSLNGTVVEKNHDFTFRVKADNNTNDDHYLVVPSILNISINGMESLCNGYKVQTPGEDESTVTIKANKIIGDIVISGTAVNAGKFNYQVSSHYGLKAVEPGTALKVTAMILMLTPEGSYNKPKAENIYVYFDAVDKWISPADADASDEYCSYDDSGASGALIIKTTHILNSIDIKARANNYKLLDSLTWGKINELSIIGSAPYVFYIGEEKTVKVNTKNHKVRILDFNHDDLADGSGKAGITFEFVNVITKSDGQQAGAFWNGDFYTDSGDNLDYRESALNNFINNDVLDMLPSSKNPDDPDLRDVIKQVDKKVAVSTDEGKTYLATDYQARLFPLAHDEIITIQEGHVASGEGTLYEYYRRHHDWLKDMQKRLAEGDGIVTYWLRSPYVESEDHDRAWIILNLGGFVGDYVYEYLYGVAPAFCI